MKYLVKFDHQFIIEKYILYNIYIYRFPEFMKVIIFHYYNGDVNNFKENDKCSIKIRK